MAFRPRDILLIAWTLAVPPAAAWCAPPAELARAFSPQGFLPVLRGPGHRRVPLLRGVASWYSERDAGARTASGQRFDDAVKTCASWDFPFGTYLRVTNVENGLAVICRVNDRGPHLRLGRAVDLTVSAFRSIAGTEKGLVRVVIEPLGPYAGRSWPRRNFREMSGSFPQ